jgi:hypothetical protein
LGVGGVWDSSEDVCVLYRYRARNIKKKKRETKTKNDPPPQQKPVEANRRGNESALPTCQKENKDAQRGWTEETKSTNSRCFFFVLFFGFFVRRCVAFWCACPCWNITSDSGLRIGRARLCVCRLKHKPTPTPPPPPFYFHSFMRLLARPVPCLTHTTHAPSSCWPRPGCTMASRLT